MKLLVTILLSILLVLFGCNSNKSATEESASNNQTITQEDTSAVNNQHANERTEVKNNGEEEIIALTQYTNFELEVEYPNNISYEVEYHYSDQGFTAEIEDAVNNVYLTGEEAKNSLIKNFELLSFDENTDESEIVIQILTAFNLTDNFTRIELDVEYNTGTVKEYKITS